MIKAMIRVGVMTQHVKPQLTMLASHVRLLV